MARHIMKNIADFILNSQRLRLHLLIRKQLSERTPYNISRKIEAPVFDGVEEQVKDNLVAKIRNITIQ
jgi:hypothetical protein